MKRKQILRLCFIAIALVFVGSLFAQTRGSDNEKGNFIQNFDKNDDGQVSKDEFPGPDKVFDSHDKNQDGYLEESEAPKGPPAGGKKGSGDFIQNFDKNDDGQVSKDEFPGPDKVFDSHDKNQDGYLEESEAPKGPPAGGKKGD
jgi:Ca2+-binding EF-hand superfamily protein